MFVIRNAEKAVKNLKKNDVVYYVVGSEFDEFYFLKVGSVKTDGDFTTIELTKAEISDCFSYIRIEKNVTTSDEYVDVDTNEVIRTEAHGELETNSFAHLWLAEIPEQTVGESFHFEIKKDSEDESGFSASGSVNGTADLKVGVTFKLYYCIDVFDPDYLDFKLIINMEVKIGVTIEGAVGYTIPLKKVSIPVFWGFEVYGHPKFFAEASGSIFVGYSYEREFGVTKFGDQKAQEIDKTESDFDPEISSEITVKIGLQFDLGAEALKIVHIELKSETGLKITGKAKANFDETKKHLCPICFDLDVDLFASLGMEVAVEVNVKVFKWEINEKFIIVEIEPAYWEGMLFEGYVSNYTGKLKIYSGDCPHYAYLITFFVQDSKNNPVSKAMIDGQYTTGSDGKTTAFYENGNSYTVDVEAPDYESATKTFTVSDSSAIINIVLKKNGEEEKPDTPDNPGGSVGNISWNYNSATKTLTLTGSGNMPDYASLTSAPWHKHYEEAEKIVVGSGITSIGNYAFAQFRNVSEIELPSTITKIGMCAFYGCNYIQSITIGDNVKSIGDYAFFACQSAKNIHIGNSVETIGKYAFAQCQAVSSINVPASVTSVGASAFKHCTNLSSITFMNSSCQIGDTEDTIFYGATIYGGSNSTAKSYASKYSRSFVAISTAKLATLSIESNGLSTQGMSNGYFAKTSGAYEGEEYVLVVVKKSANGIVLDSESLLYIDQKTAEANGEISFAFIPRTNNDCVAYIIGKFSDTTQMQVEHQSVSKPVNLMINTLPSKTSYIYKEDAVDLSGMVVTAVYYDGSTEIVELENIGVEGFDTSSTGTKAVTIEYKDASAEYEITVSYAWWQWLIRIFLLGIIWY